MELSQSLKKKLSTSDRFEMTIAPIVWIFKRERELHGDIYDVDSFFWGSLEQLHGSLSDWSASGFSKARILHAWTITTSLITLLKVYYFSFLKNYYTILIWNLKIYVYDWLSTSCFLFAMRLQFTFNEALM